MTRGAVTAVKRAARSLLRLTPAGDAARIWLPIAVTLLVMTFVFFADGGALRSVYSLLAVDVFYGLFLILTWGAMGLSTPADVQRWALAQELPRSRWRRFVAVVSDRRIFSGGAGMSTIIGVSVGGVGLAVTLLPRGGDLGAEPLRALLCVLGVLLSWALLHTSFAMYYAHLYYRIPHKPGGLAFPGEEEPGALDFAYFAFTLGTAFATSDVRVSSTKVRRTVLAHSVLAFFYNTTILALVVNLVIGSVRAARFTGTGRIFACQGSQDDKAREHERCAVAMEAIPKKRLLPRSRLRSSSPRLKFLLGENHERRRRK